MPVFALYRFHLEKIGRGSSDVFAETEDCEYNTLEEMIESRFPESGVEIQIGEIIETGQGDNRTSELVAHMTFVEAHSDNIVILNFQAIKTKTINNENWTSENVGHYPPIRIIIDTRPGRCLIAIEKKLSVIKPDKACNMLIDWFRMYLNSKSVRIECIPLSKSVDFWDGVYEIQRITHDRIRNVKFCFSKETEPDDNDRTFVSVLTRWMSVFAKNGELSLNIENDEHLKKVHDDMTRMARLCYNDSRYNLQVGFAKFGIYRYGQDVVAQYGLENDVIEKFLPHYYPKDAFTDESPKAGLIGWLDTVHQLFLDYGKPASSQQKRKKFGRI